MEIELLKDFTKSVRESTIKRLMKVPEGYEHWKISDGSLSFAEITKHLIDLDEWTLRKINVPALKAIETQTAIMDICDSEKFLQLVSRLKETLEMKLDYLNSIDTNILKCKIYDDRFNDEVSLYWIFLRGNLDHEIHHRGQIAVYLRVLEDTIK